MKKCFFLLFSFAVLHLSGGSLAAQEKNVPSLTKVAVIAPENLSKKNIYTGSDVFGKVIYNSVLTFVSILPGTTVTDLAMVPEKGENALADLSEKLRADFILYGSFNMEGPKSNPVLLVEWRLWSRAEKKDVMAKKYRTLTDIEIFDAVDSMIADSAQGILNRKVEISSIAFNNFRIGRDVYDIILNGRVAATASNDGFTFSQKVPSGTPISYYIRKRNPDKLVASGTVLLDPGAGTNIGYSAPTGLQLHYELNTVYLQTDGYVMGTNRYPVGWFGLSPEFTAVLSGAPGSAGHFSRYSWNKVFGWVFLGAGVTETLIVLAASDTNNFRAFAQEQRSWFNLGNLLGAVAGYCLSGLFFSFADCDLEKAVWEYNRFILYGNPGVSGMNDGGFPILTFSREF